jgi:hypothetical protein
MQATCRPARCLPTHSYHHVVKMKVKEGANESSELKTKALLINKRTCRIDFGKKSKTEEIDTERGTRTVLHDPCLIVGLCLVLDTAIIDRSS